MNIFKGDINVLFNIDSDNRLCVICTSSENTQISFTKQVHFSYNGNKIYNRVSSNIDKNWFVDKLYSFLETNVSKETKVHTTLEMKNLVWSENKKKIDEYIFNMPSYFGKNKITHEFVDIDENNKVKVMTDTMAKIVDMYTDLLIEQNIYEAIKNCDKDINITKNAYIFNTNIQIVPNGSNFSISSKYQTVSSTFRNLLSTIKTVVYEDNFSN